MCAGLRFKRHRRQGSLGRTASSSARSSLQSAKPVPSTWERALRNLWPAPCSSCLHGQQASPTQPQEACRPCQKRHNSPNSDLRSRLLPARLGPFQLADCPCHHRRPPAPKNILHLVALLQTCASMAKSSRPKPSGASGPMQNDDIQPPEVAASLKTDGYGHASVRKPCRFSTSTFPCQAKLACRRDHFHHTQSRRQPRRFDRPSHPQTACGASRKQPAPTHGRYPLLRLLDPRIRLLS